MRRTICTAYCLLAASGSAALAQWEPYWADEFEGSALKAEFWEAQTGTGTAYGLPAGWGNNELQYYTNMAGNLAVSDGTLKITARQQNFGGRSYTSARIRTVNRVDFKWGRVEARIRIPGTRGIWPAFWMLPTGSPYGGWASSGEIDVMESINHGTRVHGTIHFGSNWPNNASNGGSVAGGVNYAADFHEYAIEWDPDQIRWYLDGVEYHRVNANQWFSSAAPSNPRAPFDHEFHLLLNVAVGGDWPGYPDGSSQFPQTMEVDWVRVYRRARTPFGGTAHAVPGQIEAEHFDEGYPGEAYHDTDVGNQGGQLRDGDVDVQICDEGGHNVGWISNGEWLAYTVDVQTAGTYLLETRVASPNSGGAFRLEADGSDLTGPVVVPNTGGWQAWQTVSTEVELEAGVQTLRFAVVNAGAGFNFNWMRLMRQGGCSDADLAEPFGTVDLFDLLAYMDLFAAGDPAADVAPPQGVPDIFDLIGFIDLYGAGCP